MTLHTGTWADLWQDVRSDDERVTLIRNQVFESLKDPLILWTARAIVAPCASRSEECELRAIYKAVKEGPIPVRTEDGKLIKLPGLRFVDDPLGVDTYPTAHKILEWLAQGANGEDCDGHAILLCSILLVLGYQPGLIIASRDGKNYIHVFAVAGLPKNAPRKWVPLDTTVKEAGVGWWPPSSYGIKAMRVYALQEGKVKGRKL